MPRRSLVSRRDVDVTEQLVGRSELVGAAVAVGPFEFDDAGAVTGNIVADPGRLLKFAMLNIVNIRDQVIHDDCRYMLTLESGVYWN